MKNSVAVEIATAIQARANCEKTGNREWLERWSERLDYIARELLPSGSGFDSGTKIDEDSTADKLILTTSFHHMDQHGGYDGWTEHKVILRPSLLHSFVIDVKGKDRNLIKDYISDQFYSALSAEMERPENY